MKLRPNVRSQLALCAVFLILTPFIILAQVAIDFGSADYATTNKSNMQALTSVIGDFEFGADSEGDSATRRLIGEDFVTIPFDSALTTTPNKTVVFSAGAQYVNFDSSTSPTVGQTNYKWRGATPALQINFDEAAASGVSGMAFAPYVKKENFLNGYHNILNSLTFENVADSVQISTNGAADMARALVQNGTDWYVSDSSAVGILNFNGSTELWYPYDPSTNLFLDENNLGVGVLGSTLTNIKAAGVLMQKLSGAEGATFFFSSMVLKVQQSAILPAVQFGGDYADVNTSGSAAVVMKYENGDFGGSADTLDRRGYNPIDTAFPSTADTNNLGTNSVFDAGFQVTYFDNTATDPLRGIYRFRGESQAQDQLQIGAGDTSAGIGQTLTFAPNISKASFLNSYDDRLFNLSFKNTDSISIETEFAKSDGVEQTTIRAIVKDGNDWYVSGASASDAGVLEINGFTDTWYPYSPDTNLIIPSLADGVAGSTLTDIQSVGLIAELTVSAGQSINSGVLLVKGLTVLMDQTALSFPPTTPVEIKNAQTQFENDITDNIHTLADFRVIDAPNSKLVVAVGGEATGATTSVTYGGVNLTLADEINSQDVSIWYLDDPTPGDADIVATLTNNKESRIVALSLSNAADGVGSATKNREGDSVQLDLQLGTAAPNTLLVGAFVNNAADIVSTPFSASGTTVVSATSGSSEMNLGYVTVADVVDATYSWVNNQPTRSSAVLIGIPPAAEVAPEDSFSAFDSPITVVTPVVDGIKSLGEWGDAIQLPMRWPELGILPNVGGIKYTSDDGSGSPSTVADSQPDDISAVFSFKWDATNLYLLAEVTDDVVIKPEPPSPTRTKAFPDDHFILAIDPDQSDVDANASVFIAEFAIANDDSAKVYYRSDLGIADPVLNDLVNHSISGGEVAGGYLIEMAFNWADLGVTNPVADDTIGISILLIDNDADDDRRDIIMNSYGDVTKPSEYHTVTLAGAKNTFANFIREYDVGVYNQPSDDPDRDGVNNFEEFALGGNPGAGDSQSIQPTFQANAAGDLFTYVYNRRLGANALGLTYSVLAETDLVNADWNTGGVTETSSVIINDEFEQVTNTVNMTEGKKFLRLVID